MSQIDNHSQHESQILNASAIGVLITRVSDGMILYANQAVANLLGVAQASAVIGRPVPNFYWDATERASLLERFRAEGSVKNRALRARRADGSLLWVSVSMQPFVFEGEQAILSDVIDITAQKEAEEALRQSVEKFHVVSDFSYYWELWRDPDGNYLYISPACERISGYSPEDFAKNPKLLEEIIHPEDQEKWKKHTQEYHTSHSAEDAETEFRIITKNGKTRWLNHVCRAIVDSRGNWLGRRASQGDVTEKRQLQQHIEETARRREREVQISAEITQEIASAPDLNSLLERVVTLTKELFGYYHVQVLRYDPVQDAVALLKGYGETGQKMLEMGHKMPMGIGLIGGAAATGETVARPTLENDPDWKPNPLLPETKGEIAAPIKWKGKVLGVLDVQSDKAGALDEDDRLLLESLCGQIALAMEENRLRQETEERLEEISRLYRAMSREGWETYRQEETLPSGFLFEHAGVLPVEQAAPAQNVITLPIALPGGEEIGELAIPENPQRPLSAADRDLLAQIAEQIALALESARLNQQTQSALAQTEKLSAASLQLARAANLQELLKITVETLAIKQINRAVLGVFEYKENNEISGMSVVANWWNGAGSAPTEIGKRYPADSVRLIRFFQTAEPLFYNDTLNDPGIDEGSLRIIRQQNIRALAVLPLFTGERQTGVILLEAEEPYRFSPNEVRLFSAMGPQVATVLENRRQFERARKQAEREAMLNLISQKIQSASSVDDVLQIAARELGQALGAPITIARLKVQS